MPEPDTDRTPIYVRLPNPLYQRLIAAGTADFGDRHGMLQHATIKYLGLGLSADKAASPATRVSRVVRGPQLELPATRARKAAKRAALKRKPVKHARARK